MDLTFLKSYYLERCVADCGRDVLQATEKRSSWGIGVCSVDDQVDTSTGQADFGTNANMAKE